MGSISDVSESDVLSMVLDAYGICQVYDRDELNKMMTKDGDIEMDSAPAGAVIAKIERQLGRELPEPSDLRPEEFNSVKNLTAVIVRKLREGEGKPLKRTKTTAISAKQ